MVFDRIREWLGGDDKPEYPHDHLTTEQLTEEIEEMRAAASDESADPDRAEAAAEAADPGEATAGASDGAVGRDEPVEETTGNEKPAEEAVDLDVTVPTDAGGTALVETGEETALVGSFDGVTDWLDDLDAEPDRYFPLRSNLEDPASTGALEMVRETDADHVVPYTWGVDDDADLRKRDETQESDEFRRYVEALHDSGTDYTVHARGDDPVSVAPGVEVDRTGNRGIAPGGSDHVGSAVVRRTDGDDTFETVVTDDPRGGYGTGAVEQTVGRDEVPVISPAVASPDIVVTGDRGGARDTPLSTDIEGATSVVAGGEALYAEHLDALAEAHVDGVADAESDTVTVAVDGDSVTADGLLAPAAVERERYEGRNGQDGQGDPGGAGAAGVSLSPGGGEQEEESVDREREAEPETERTVEPAEGNWLAADGEELFERPEPEETVSEEQGFGMGL